MSLIVDASISVKWFVNEAGSETARSCKNERLVAPDLILVETFNAIHKRVRRRQLDAEQLRGVVRLTRLALSEIVASGPLMDAAARLAQSIEHVIYDCVYITLAQREGATLLTADLCQFEAAQRANVDAQLLADRS